MLKYLFFQAVHNGLSVEEACMSPHSQTESVRFLCFISLGHKVFHLLEGNHLREFSWSISRVSHMLTVLISSLSSFSVLEEGRV